jgi:hypothetical protein
MLRIFIKLPIALYLISGSAFGAFGEVVSSFALPPATGTSGLAWDGAYLWIAGEPYTHFIRKNKAGSTVGSFNLGGTYSYIEGLTFDGEYLWYSWHELGRGYYYYRINTAGSLVGSFMYTWPYGKGGLTWDSPYLWCGPAKYTTTGSLVATFSPPFGLSDLGWYGHKLWSGGPNKHMYNITTNGSVVASFAVPGDANASAAAFDGQYLWLINSTNKYVYQIDIDVVGMNPGSMGKIKGLYR